MRQKQIFSVCGMCDANCPILVEISGNGDLFITGDPKTPGIRGALCARGAAGAALTMDDERPLFPMIRRGKRGEGRWKKASWDQALEFAADSLKNVISEHKARAVLFSDPGDPFLEINKAFVRGLGSPNYCDLGAYRDINVHHAALSLFGFGADRLVCDYKNARRVVLQGKNPFEALDVREVNDLLDARETGCRLTVVDIRAGVCASKAHEFFMIRPGTDLALNLAVIRHLLAESLFDHEFADLWIKDMDALRQHVHPYTPDWAEEQTGIDARAVEKLAEDLASAAPAVIWHPGRTASRYRDSFYTARTAYIINALLGCLGAKGGLVPAATPEDFGKKSLNRFTDLVGQPNEKRADGAGHAHPELDPERGLLHRALMTAETGDPYPVKAYIAHCSDPLMDMPDRKRLARVWDRLDLIVSITPVWSETAWFSDVVLPASPYLESSGPVAQFNGLLPHFSVRKKVVEPRHDTRPQWRIIADLAERLDIKPLAFQTIEQVWDYQLKGTGMTIADFDRDGPIFCAEKPKYPDVRELKFPTASGRIELVNELWEKNGTPSLKPYESPEAPPEGTFRLTSGRTALHTESLTQNNYLLNEQMPENVLWINKDAAAGLKIEDGDAVEVASDDHKARIRAFVTEFIHPEAVFMVHGFGQVIAPHGRAKNKGASDTRLMSGGLDKQDKAGGGPAMQEHFVTVRKIKQDED